MMNAQLKPLLWAGIGATIAVVLMKAWPEQETEAPADTPVSKKEIRKSQPKAGESESSQVPDSSRTTTRTLSEPFQAEKEAFESLAAKYDAGTATEKEQLEFWEMIRSSPYFEKVLEDLKDQVEADPKDVENRLKLAEMYVLKLLTASAGPVRGIWGMKASKLWNEVLEVDPVNWEAQHSIAFSYSQYPDFMNKTDDSIEAYENLLNFPRKGEPGPKHAKAVLELAKLYRKRGRAADAHKLLESGLSDHPDHQNLKKEFSSLKEQFVFDEDE